MSSIGSSAFVNSSIVQALHDWPFALWLRTAPLVYPALESLHLIAIATTFGTLLIVDLRLLNVGVFGLRQFDVNAIAKAVLPWTLFGFVFAAITGGLMFLSRAGDFISNGAFLIKMLLLFAAATNAGILHSRGRLDATHFVTRMQAAVSLIIWITVIVCGRWIAYV
ncbi:MAG: hypothetical protein EAZ30_00790 [Betaproteobacteria bacterium]|nr:MAG: hypothetical protein EAZ30_00790 [Betaproteobacteria bacterium]